MKKSLIKNFIKEETGATSVLVILMMIVLIALGSFAITSANSNIKLSKTAAAWNVMYYNLDAEGEKYISNIDNALYSAEQNALNYMLDKEYSQLTHKDLPMELQTEIRFSIEEAGANNINTYNALNAVYYYYVVKYLDELDNTYPDNIVSFLDEGLTIKAVISEIMFISKENPYCHLKVSVEVNPLDYVFTLDGEFDEEEIPDDKRYTVLTWTQNQTQPLLDDGQKLWDGKIK